MILSFINATGVTGKPLFISRLLKKYFHRLFKNIQIQGTRNPEE